MNRREWLKTTGALAAGSMFANLVTLPSFGMQSPACVWETSIIRLKLRHTWTTTVSSSEYRDTIQVRLTTDGVTGVGEGAPIVRYHENAEAGRKAIEAITPVLRASNPWLFEKIMVEVSREMPGQFATKAGISH